MEDKFGPFYPCVFVQVFLKWVYFDLIAKRNACVHKNYYGIIWDIFQNGGPQPSWEITRPKREMSFYGNRMHFRGFYGVLGKQKF